MTVGGALALARASMLGRLDAQLLLAHCLGRSRGWLLAHDDAPVPPDKATAFERLVARRATGVPVAQLVGTKEFHGLMLRVTAATLVPRPDTETLVDWALERLAGGPPAPRVLDLGTGSGAIALALKHRHPAAQVCATDLSAAAIEVARANGACLGLEVEWLSGDWWQPVAGRRFDLVVANPPYVAEGDPHLPALRHEPRLALVAGADGLDALRAIVAGAAAHLAPGAWLLLEHGHDQAADVRDLLAADGLRSMGTRTDLAGHARCSGAAAPLP